MSDLHVLTGAYAGGALSGAERVAFEEHLTSCGHCREEVRELTETAALLGIAATEPAPLALRARVLAEIAQTRQLSPLVAQISERRRAGVRGRRWSMTVAACLAVFSIGLGAYASALTQENSDLRRQSDRIAAVAAAPDARTVMRTAGGATGSLTMSRSNDEMVFVSRGLTALDDDRTYQLWLIGSGGAEPVGTFRQDEGQHTTRLIHGAGDASSLALTVEPRGGSPKPTTTPVLWLPLPKAA